MTVDLEEKLVEETVRALEHAKELSPDTEEYCDLMDQIRKNCDVLNKVDQIGYEEARAVDDRIMQRELKERELKVERRKNWVTAGLTAAGIVVPAALYAYLYEQGLKFEENGAVTSTFFRNLLNKVKPV